MEESFILPQPLIKVEEYSDIIDLDFHKTSEDIIDKWHAKICMKFKHDIIADSERSLDSLMKWYIQCLKDDAASFENHERLKLALTMHLQFFKLCFVELNCCFADNYLDNMEEILAFYLELEMKSVKKNSPDSSRKAAYKRHISKFCHRIIATVKLYLLGREDRMYHVIMKMRAIELSCEAKDLFNLFCGKILTAQPSNKSDLAFCRAYILYQKWKEIRNPEERAKMDEIMYRVYDRTPESVKTNEILRQILLPQQDSLIQVLAHFHGNLINITEEYFKFFRSFSFQEECAVLPENMTNMDLLDHETNWGEDEEFNKAYENYLKSMTNVSSEQDDEDDCQFVSVTTRGCSTDDNDVDIVHLIEDDDDISEVIVFNKKESFLDSIDILDGEEIISTPVQPVTMNNVHLNYTPPIKTDEPVLIPSTISTNPEEQRHEVEESDVIDRRTNDSPTNSASESTAHIPEPPVPLAAKSVETQTENFVCVEHDSIFNRFDGLVTPPSDQHSDDHDVRARDSSNIYAQFVQPPAPSTQNECVPSAGTESGDQCSTHELALRDLLSPLLTETEKELDNIPLFQFDQDINSQSPLDNLNQTSANDVRINADPHQKQNANATPPNPDSNEFSEGSLGNEAENVPTNMLVSEDVSLPASECLEASVVSVDRSSNVSSSQVSEVLYSSPDISSTSVDNFIENSLAMDVGPEEHRSNESVTAVENSVPNAQERNSDGTVAINREENIHNESVSQSNLEDITASVEDPVVTTVEEPHHSETVSTNHDAEKAGELHVLNDLSVSAVTEPTKNLNGDEQNATRSEKIMFTVQKAARKEFLNDFSTFEETIHRRWNILKEAHNLEDVLTGPVAKIDRLNGCLNPDKNFDLFDNRTVSTVPPTSSSVDELSPAFEDGLDDFRNFYDEKKKNSVLAVSSSTCSDLDGNIKGSADKEGKLSVSTHLFPKKTNSLIKCDGSTVKSKETPRNTVRKKRIAFAENVIETEPPITHSPTEIPVKTLQGILKKYPRENCENNHRNGTKKIKHTKRRIPKKLMNLKSLDHYKISPDDPRFQSGLCVVLDKNKVSQWLKIKELSQKFKEQKQRKEREILMMDCLTGTTTRITMNDIFRKETALPISNFDIPPQWRNNASRLKYNNREEGTVASNPFNNLADNEYNNSIPDQCKSTCCINLTADLTNLNVSRAKSGTVLSLCCCDPDPTLDSIHKSHSPKPNPFLLKTKKRAHFEHSTNIWESEADECVSNLDLSFVSSIVDSFYFKFQDAAISNLDLNLLNFDNDCNQQLHEPAVVSEPKELDKTIKFDELATKTTTIPSDLHNLNLRKFSPSPIINCLYSPGHTFVTDGSSNDKLQYIQDSRTHSSDSSMNEKLQQLQTDCPSVNEKIQSTQQETHWQTDFISDCLPDIKLQPDQETQSEMNSSFITDEKLLLIQGTHLDIDSSLGSLCSENEKIRPVQEKQLNKMDKDIQAVQENQSDYSKNKKLKSKHGNQSVPDSSFTSYCSLNEEISPFQAARLKIDSSFIAGYAGDEKLRPTQAIQLKPNSSCSSAFSINDDVPVKETQLKIDSSLGSDHSLHQKRQCARSSCLESDSSFISDCSVDPIQKTEVKAAYSFSADHLTYEKTGFISDGCLHSEKLQSAQTTRSGTGSSFIYDCPPNPNLTSEDNMNNNNNTSNNNEMFNNDLPMKHLENEFDNTAEYCKNDGLWKRKIEVNVLDADGTETRLPLKKRKLSVADAAEDIIGPDLIEEILKQARAEKSEKEDISYPAKPMISIAEIQENLMEPQHRAFKTPAEKKEMPRPPPAPPQGHARGAFLDTPKIVTEQYNNHTYNNPTINYHMNNVPYPFFPCASIPYFPPILLPVNSTATFDMNLVASQQQQQHQQAPVVQEASSRPRREKKARGRKKNV